MRILAVVMVGLLAAGFAEATGAQEGTKAAPAGQQLTTVDPRQQQAEEFQSSLETAISVGREVARTEKERGDLKTLEFLLGDYKKHVADGDWSRADEVRSRMQVVITRNGSLVADAARRKAQQERLMRERQHRELMAQRERHHREQMLRIDRRTQDLLIRLQLQPGVRIGVPDGVSQ